MNVMSIFKIGFLAPVVIGLFALAATPAAHANYVFSGTGTSGNLDGSSEPWVINADGGSMETGYLDNWGSPGVGYSITAYSRADAAYGMSITFSGGGTINDNSIAIGNGANCAGSTAGGSTFCTFSPNDFWVAFLTSPSTIEFRAQDPSFYLSNGQNYFVNIFFDGAAPTSFSGKWLTEFAPDPGTVPVPEPAAIGMFGTGLFALGLMLMLRRRRRY
jgi:hypothetical protein